MDYFLIKGALFLFGSSKLGLCLGMLGSNLVKLRDRQTSNIAIRLVVADVFGVTIRINKVKKIDKPFALVIMTKGYFYWALKNQL